jgi:hypothetical protein|tara:strand:- start:2173 stop:2346 length:174 start_codon:yes stop_codon:yes gene_type:complete
MRKEERDSIVVLFFALTADAKEREKERQEDTFSKRHPKMFISPFLFFSFFKIQVLFW